MPDITVDPPKLAAASALLQASAASLREAGSVVDRTCVAVCDAFAARQFGSALLGCRPALAAAGEQVAAAVEDLAGGLVRSAGGYRSAEANALPPAA